MSLTIVMYHYVRPLARTRFPDVKGRDLDEFRGQLAHLTARYRILSFDDVIDAARSGEDLGDDAALLTFDDGLADHYDYVTPLLVDAGVTGAFFPASAPLLESRMLDVQRAQFVLASGADPIELGEQIDDHVRERSLGDPSELRAAFAHPSRWDPPEVVYVKRMLQVGLPPGERSTLAAALFARHVTADEAAFVEELYCTVEQLRLMHAVGMHVGSHTHDHHWLTSMGESEQDEDLARSLELLAAVGVDVEAGWTLAYPYGDHDATTIGIATALGCVAALSTEVRTADLAVDALMSLPRLNTNDLPVAP
jgi:peptidoglycan/xylan/chitin deacetylase (PgdA/CDA1 family)